MYAYTPKSLKGYMHTHTHSHIQYVFHITLIICQSTAGRAGPDSLRRLIGHTNFSASQVWVAPGSRFRWGPGSMGSTVGCFYKQRDRL
jgi:hypothetical protein